MVLKEEVLYSIPKELIIYMKILIKKIFILFFITVI